MPYTIVKRGNGPKPYKIIRKSDGKVVGSSSSKKNAEISVGYREKNDKS